MTKEPITFDKLPQAVSYLTEQVEKIYQLVETLQPQKLDHKHEDELLKWIEAGKKQSQPLSYQEQSAQILRGMKRKPRSGG